MDHRLISLLCVFSFKEIFARHSFCSASEAFILVTYL